MQSRALLGCLVPTRSGGPWPALSRLSVLPPATRPSRLLLVPKLNMFTVPPGDTPALELHVLVPCNPDTPCCPTSVSGSCESAIPRRVEGGHSPAPGQQAAGACTSKGTATDHRSPWGGPGAWASLPLIRLEGDELRKRRRPVQENASRQGPAGARPHVTSSPQRPIHPSRTATSGKKPALDTRHHLAPRSRPGCPCWVRCAAGMRSPFPPAPSMPLAGPVVRARHHPPIRQPCVAPTTEDAVTTEVRDDGGTALAAPGRRTRRRPGLALHRRSRPALDP